MYEEIIKRISESIDTHNNRDIWPVFSGEGYSPFKIESSNFQEIARRRSEKRMAFIDAGNAEILGSANFSLNMLRACFAVYVNNKKSAYKKFDCFALANAVNKNDEIKFNISFFGEGSLGMDDLLFSSLDRSLMAGLNRADIKSGINAARRFAELKLAKIIIDGKLADMIILDGNLQSSFTNEDIYLEDMYSSAKKNDVILSALSKTNSLFTSDGNLVSTVLASKSPYRSWIYHPLAGINAAGHKAEMYFVKLHESSRHIFRFEVFNEQKDHAKEVIEMIASNSLDPVFIGYPHGLVEADKIARVSNQEKEFFRTIFLSKIKSKNLQNLLNYRNAHEILDKIGF